MSRKSIADLSIVPEIPLGSKPKPPAELTPEQSIVWNDTVSAMPAGWFKPETHNSLIQYCRHVAAASFNAFLITEMQMRPFPMSKDEAKKEDGETEPEAYFDLEAYDRLLKMQERESRAANALARSMRITLQATYDKSKKKEGGGNMPWEEQG